MPDTPSQFTSLTAISPLDGRYRNKIKELSEYISEYALIKTRIEIEIKYLCALSDIKIVRKFTQSEKRFLENLYMRADIKTAEEVKRIEKETRHDVKAVERFIRNNIRTTTLEDITEAIHIGLTSEDVNNLAYRLLLYRASKEAIIPALGEIVFHLSEIASSHKALVMLGRTHGQAAIPTTLGKEIAIFAHRLNEQLKQIKKLKLTGKLNGAIGNFSAMHFAYPKTNWIRFAEKFISSLGFIPNTISTQINPYDDVVEYFHICQRINNILIGLNQDIWRYISDGWFVQEIKKGEIGSSTMPQKVNPIDFENSEGNLGIANALMEFVSRKLLVSRLQRDLSDSTVIRNVGAIYGYSLIAYKSLLTGLSRIRVHEKQIDSDLHKEWAVLAEGVQTLLRKEGVEDPYTLLASLSKGKHIDKKEWQQWIKKIPVKVSIKKQLMKLTPYSYIGYAVELTEAVSKGINSKKNTS